MSRVNDANDALDALRRARDAAVTRARAFARGPRAGAGWGRTSARVERAKWVSGTVDDADDANGPPPCVVACGRAGGGGTIARERSWVAGLVPGERFYLEFDRARSFTVEYPARPEAFADDGGTAAAWRRAARETTRRRQLATYALGPDGGVGLCGWSPGEDPDVAFRDGTMRDGDARFETGLCVFTTLAREDASDGAGGSVGTLCQWVRRNMNGERSRSFVDERHVDVQHRFDFEAVPSSWTADECLMEFRAISVVWVEFPGEHALSFEDLYQTEAAMRLNRDPEDPFSWFMFQPTLINFDLLYPSAAPVYSLGVHSVRENRTKDARALMLKILNVLRAQGWLWYRKCLGREDNDLPWRDADLPPFAQQPSGFSYWILHALPGTIGNEFRRLVLLTDDVFVRLSLVWLKLKLELTMPRELVPVTHSCGHVVSYACLMHPTSNSYGLRSPEMSQSSDDNDNVFGNDADRVFSCIFGDPTGGIQRVSVFCPAARFGDDDDTYPNTPPEDIITNVNYDASGPHFSSYTWFVGSFWRAVSCPGCDKHCGFRFLSQEPKTLKESEFFALQDVVTCWDGVNEVDGVDTKDLLRKYFESCGERFDGDSPGTRNA